MKNNKLKTNIRFLAVHNYFPLSDFVGPLFLDLKIWQIIDFSAVFYRKKKQKQKNSNINYSGGDGGGDKFLHRVLLKGDKEKN